MIQVLSLLLISFVITSLSLVPFINFLYKFKFQRQNQLTRDMFNNHTPIYDLFHASKAGVPVGGGILLIFIMLILPIVGYALTPATWNWRIGIILITMVLFGLLGFYDDSRKFFKTEQTQFFGLRFRHKLLIQVILAIAISFFIYRVLNFHSINILWNLNNIDLGWLFVPLASIVIVAFTNAVNIADGLDGEASGLLIICLVAFLILTRQSLNASIDSTLSAFIGTWIGALIAFLYFNVHPARLLLGDVGAMSFGATLAVVGLLTGKTAALAVIGGIFVIEVMTSLLQLLWKRYFGHKLFPVAPLHLYLQLKGWQEPKIVMRFWIAGALFAVIGLLIAVAK